MGDTLLASCAERCGCGITVAVPEEAYVWWVRRFIRFCGRPPSARAGERDVTRSCPILRWIEASVHPRRTRRCPRCVYSTVRCWGWRWAGFQRWAAKRPERMPVVLTRDEVRGVLARLRGTERLIAGLSYGSGLRLFEALRATGQDIDFERGEVPIRGGRVPRTG